MRDIALRADTEADLIDALPWAREGDEWVRDTDDYCLVLHGPLQLMPAVMDADEAGEPVEISPAVVDTRFHADLRLMGGFEPDIPGAVIIHPANPLHRFS
jgi:hypothetical protein